MSLEGVGAQPVKSLTEVDKVGCSILRIDQDIIKVNSYRLIEHVKEHSVHQALKTAGGVTQSKRHNAELKKSKLGEKSGLVLIPWLDLHLVVTLGKVQLGKYSSTLQLIQEVLYMWQWVTIPNSTAIKRTEVHTQT